MSQSTAVYLAFDLGAGSGRAMVGLLEAGKLRMKEIHRFANAPLSVGGRLSWDANSLWNHALESMRRCARRGHNRLAGVGVDAWGVDFGLVGADGNLLDNPLCYRDCSTEGIERRIAAAIPEKRLLRWTGAASAGCRRSRNWPHSAAVPAKWQNVHKHC